MSGVYISFFLSINSFVLLRRSISTICFFLIKGFLPFVFVNIACFVIIVLSIKIGTLGTSWDSLYTSPTQQTKRTECCVLGTPTTPGSRYLTLSTSPVLTTGDTSSTITTGLILRILRGILITPFLDSVKWKCTVRTLQGFTIGNETRVFQWKKKKKKTTNRTA